MEQIQSSKVIKKKPRYIQKLASLGGIPVWRVRSTDGRMSKHKVGDIYFTVNLVYNRKKKTTGRYIHFYFSHRDKEDKFKHKDRTVISASGLLKLLKVYLSYGPIKHYNLKKYKNYEHELRPEVKRRLKKYNPQFKMPLIKR